MDGKYFDKLTRYFNRPSDATPVRKAYEDTDLLLLCRVDAFPSPTISVGKNGEGIVPSERVSIEMNSTEYKEDDLGGDSMEFRQFNSTECNPKTSCFLVTLLSKSN